MFEAEEDEESYKRFRSRERNEAVLRDYVEEYSSSTDYGDLILGQRLQMVNWIMEVRISERRPPLPLSDRLVLPLPVAVYFLPLASVLSFRRNWIVSTRGD